MSYQKIKSMSIKEIGNGTLSIKLNVASNNIIPITYQKWECERTWSELFYNLIGQDWKPNDSANNYFWSALMSVMFDMIEKDGMISYYIWLAYHNENSTDKEKEMFNKYVQKFKETYYLLKELSASSYKYKVTYINGYVVKVLERKIFVHHCNGKDFSLCEAIVIRSKAIKTFSLKHVNILPDLNQKIEKVNNFIGKL